MVEIEEIFKNLIEIQSISKVLEKEKSLIAEENRRLTFLKAQEAQQLAKKIEINSEILELENKIQLLELSCSELEKNIKQSQDAEKNAVNQNQLIKSNEQRKFFEEKHQKEYQEFFELLEILDLKKSEQKEIQEYLLNFPQSYNDIKQEVEALAQQKGPLLEGLNARILALLEDLPIPTQNLFKGLKKKFHDPILFVGLGLKQSCLGCHSFMERSLLELIHSRKTLETCPHCSRILIPFNH